ncbi:MAG: sensor histidine kinase [Bacteroidia bacterium]
MNIYTQKQRWKLLLMVAAFFIGAASLWYTNRLVDRLSEEERKKVELWAQGTRELATMTDDGGPIGFIFEVITNNNTVPVILVNEKDEIISFRNLDSLKSQEPKYLKEQLTRMKEESPPIIIELPNGQENYIYYRESLLLTQLRFYPYFQLGVIALFLLVSYLAFSASRKAEQNQVWVGMAKETAHQLGTPLSSLMAWVEYLKLKADPEDKYIVEVEKDIYRLNTITERFSKIGAAPALKRENLVQVLQHSVDYMRSRVSAKLIMKLISSETKDILVPMNAPLFEWVIENLLKNAIDAMKGIGSITLNLSENNQQAIIDISDTGSGLSKSQFKTIFKPGFTTKSRGWGLGLSLSKRIIEEYHGGQIFVKSSHPGKGTTFRIILPKAVD